MLSHNCDDLRLLTRPQVKELSNTLHKVSLPLRRFRIFPSIDKSASLSISGFSRRLFVPLSFDSYLIDIRSDGSSLFAQIPLTIFEPKPPKFDGPLVMQSDMLNADPVTIDQSKPCRTDTGQIFFDLPCSVEQKLEKSDYF